MFNLKGKDSEKYFKEVENKLVEETDYILEVAQSQEITKACKVIPNIKFPEYYTELSSERIITMDWMTGMHLSEFAKTNFSQATGDKLGQALWDFYMFQIHGLRKVHADPHPGNFLVNDDNELIAIDFGCIKEVPDSFYVPYFELARPEIISDDEKFTAKLYELEILMASDTPEEILFFKSIFHQLLSLFTSPFHNERFDFGDEVFWGKIAALGEQFSSDKQIRKMNGNRGSKHFLYMNRTFFGLYNLLHDLKANIIVNDYKKYLD